MSIRTRISMVLALIALPATVAFAAPVHMKVDAVHSKVGFEVRHFFSMVGGNFKTFDADIQFDAKDLAKSTVTATADVASINTENERRDNHLKSDDFFAADKNPQLTLKSTKITPGKDGAFKMAADLTMRGVTKPVVFDGKVLGSGMVDMGGGASLRAGFHLETTVNRKDFGINWNRTLDQGGAVLGDDVKILIDVEAAEAK